VSARTRIAVFAAAISASTGLLAFGIFREEMGEVMFNASMLCLSCIGMG